MDGNRRKEGTSLNLPAWLLANAFKRRLPKGGLPVLENLTVYACVTQCEKRREQICLISDPVPQSPILSNMNIAMQLGL